LRVEVDLKIITLLTDFGLQDGFVGTMRGVILGIAPDTQIADISHSIKPQNIREASIALQRSVKYYSEGTVHIIVIDPGVGTARRPIAARLGSQFFVAPDNGVLTYVLKDARSKGLSIEFVHLDNPRYWLNEISNVFHGRDIFAPVGAHLANGISLDKLGSKIDDFILLDIPSIASYPKQIMGEIILIDNFGNLISNIEAKDLNRFDHPKIKICGIEIQGIEDTFGKRKEGELIALIGDAQDLWISVVNGNAEERTNAKIGDVIEILEDETK
jgi:S-adenosyl-L-methionine hydrolase (adenosine-forming)